MKNRLIKIIVTIIQLFVLVPPIVLQYLSDKKMGVNRYLVFKKRIFAKEMFTPNLMFFYKTILILGIIMGSIAFVYYLKNTKNSILKKLLLNSTILNLIAAACVFSSGFKELLAYHFFLIAIFVVIILQWINRKRICSVKM